MRFFNTAGPISPDIHYHIPPLRRLEYDEVLMLIRQQKYFVLHAPRQTGKTTSLLALRDELNCSSEFRCVYVSVEIGQVARENVYEGVRVLFGALLRSAWHVLGSSFVETFDTIGHYDAIAEVLSRWAEVDAKPLVLMIDEIDALVGDALLSVLRQLRAGYPERPDGFPQSVILCGVRDVRDYRIRSTAQNAVITGSSVFNITAESLRLRDFSPPEVESLLIQHTEETGQVFMEEARRDVWELTQGQPWLVNALAYEACFRNTAARDRSRPITANAIRDAREQLIRRRETHLDQLTDKLQEERVRRVIEPLLSGAVADPVPADDLEYVRDLGLITRDGPVRIANPIYREMIRAT